jgi:kynureninase
MGNPFASVGLAGHYSRFRVSHRLLLTGHSHQAWPDVAFDAQQRAWLDAAALVDDKWERAFAMAEDVRAGWRRLLTDPNGDIALGQNTHELIVRLLSALAWEGATLVAPPGGADHLRQGFGGQEAPPSKRPDSGSRRSHNRRRLITTDGEFHTIRRQLDRLAEEGVEVIKVAAHPAETLAERLAAAVGDDTACVMVSSVLFETAEIVPNLHAVAEACTRHGATLLVDAYHHLNVVPFDINAMGLAGAFVVGGGYKYCQLGEGNCFLRIPPDCNLRPVVTGWFSEFGDLARPRADRGVSGALPNVGDRAPADSGRAVEYGEGGARFAGATYDPTAHYRAAAVFAFHQRMGMTAERLRSVSQHQMTRIVRQIEALDLDPSVAQIIPMPRDRRAGFLAIRSSRAAAIVLNLRARNIFADTRGDVLRLGPAPYISDQQLLEAGGVFSQVFKR